MPQSRTASIERKTRETLVRVKLNLDGEGTSETNTGIGFLDHMSFERQVIDIALQHQLVTKFTSLVAVDENISRNPDEPIFSHQIAHNIPEGWVDPEVMKQATSVQNYISNSNTIDAWLMEPIELKKFPALQVQFVQTATGKELFYLLVCILLSGAAFLFYFRQRLY